MRWPHLDEIRECVPNPSGYRLEMLNADEVSHFVTALEEWYPDIHVGGESRFLKPEFYWRVVLQPDIPIAMRYYLPIIFRHECSGELSGCVFLEKNEQSLTITAPMGAIATNHRHTGSGLSFLPSRLIAGVGRMMKLELAYYISTLRSRANQVIAEKTGYKLVGIIPGNDRDMVFPGLAKRVFEAIYAQLLIPVESLHIPMADSLTENTRNLWSVLFPSIPLR